MHKKDTFKRQFKNFSVDYNKDYDGLFVEYNSYLPSNTNCEMFEHGKNRFHLYYSPDGHVEAIEITNASHINTWKNFKTICAEHYSKYKSDYENYCGKVFYSDLENFAEAFICHFSSQELIFGNKFNKIIEILDEL